MFSILYILFYSLDTELFHICNAIVGKDCKNEILSSDHYGKSNCFQSSKIHTVETMTVYFDFEWINT